MNEELERLINGLIADASCYLCDTPITIQAENLTRKPDGNFVSDYYCTGCDVGYDIEIEDLDHMISFSAYRMDIDNREHDIAEISRGTRKEALQRQTHPVKGLVEGLDEIINALIILQQNRERIHDACETLRADGFNQDSDFGRRVTTDLHNYMASAYTFEEILETVEPNLPTDGPVVSSKGTFDDENMLIKGLRTYAQHHLSLPYSFTQFQDQNTEQMETTITTSLEDVGKEEVEEFNYKDPSISYKKVEGDRINIERRINLHCIAARKLVREIHQYAESTHEDELKDYRESTRYDLE